MILVSPYGSTYTFVLLIFPMLAIAGEKLPKAKIAALFFLAFAVNNLPLSVFLDWPFPLSYLRLLALLSVFALVLRVVSKSADGKIIGAIGVVSFLIGCFCKPETANSAFALKNSPLLVNDFSIGADLLTIRYWENGEHATSFPFPHHFAEPADLVRNAVYIRGKLIRTETGHILKPVVIDGKWLLYLSDHGRGIGFYTLRKIDL
jgi:hypothetical protein